MNGPIAHGCSMGKGRISEMRGKYEEAIARYEKALALEPYLETTALRDQLPVRTSSTRTILRDDP